MEALLAQDNARQREGPVVLAFVYYECPMLCTQVMNGLSSALKVMSFQAGQDFEVVLVSFDPRDTPASAASARRSTSCCSTCFHYDPEAGRYGVVVMNLIRPGGVLTMLFIGGFILLMRHRGSGPPMEGHV